MRSRQHELDNMEKNLGNIEKIMDNISTRLEGEGQFIDQMENEYSIDGYYEARADIKIIMKSIHTIKFDKAMGWELEGLKENINGIMRAIRFLGMREVKSTYADGGKQVQFREFEVGKYVYIDEKNEWRRYL